VYLKRLFASLAVIFSLAGGYVVYFNTHYPIPITDHISFDAKLKFVRDRIDPDQVDTLIIGSSIGLNDLLGTEMEKHSKVIKKALNFSVYGATTLQAEQIMQLMDAFPNLKRIIYSAQYSDFPHTWKFKLYDPSKLVKYMRHELNPFAYLYLVFKSCANLPFCFERQKSWIPDHMRTNTFESLIFDPSGSVPLHIYGKDIISHRWRLPHPGIMNPESFRAVARMAKNAKEKNIRYYVVHQPYRQPLYDKHQSVRDAMAYFDTKILAEIQPYGGTLIKIQPMHLSDDYFSDRTHLNDKGSPIVSEYVAKKIDEIESK
jgi:hypothetical protein